MRRIRSLLVLLFSVGAVPVYGDEGQALTYYRQGESHLSKEEYQAALVWYRKALEDCGH